MKGFALGLALEQRRNATRKSPIDNRSQPLTRHAQRYSSLSNQRIDGLKKPLTSAVGRLDVCVTSSCSLSDSLVERMDVSLVELWWTCLDFTLKVNLYG